MNSIKLKDKKIAIYEKIEGYNDRDGYNPGGYKKIHDGTLWAYVRHVSAKEFWAWASQQNTEDMIFVINWRADINANMFIAYKNKWFNITRVDGFEGYKTDLTLYTSEVTTPPDKEEIIA